MGLIPLIIHIVMLMLNESEIAEYKELKVDQANGIMSRGNIVLMFRLQEKMSKEQWEELHG